MRSQQKHNRKHRNRTVALLLILSFLVAMLPTFMLSAEADTDEITIVREEADRRNANERHYLCSDGSIMAVAFSGDVHYLDADGKYQVIDNSLVYDNTKGLYRTKDNPNFTVAFGDNTKSPSVQLTNGEGNTLTTATTVALRLESTVARRALENASASLTVANCEKITVAGKSKQSADLLKVPENSSEMKYQNSFGNGISAEYAVDGYSLKENVVFEYPVNYTAIETRYTMEGLWIDVNEDGSLILYNEDNLAIYTVAAPYMYDAAGSECPSVDVQATLEGDTIVVRYIPDEAWRSSSERVYPVVFDPLTSSQANTNIGDVYSIRSDSHSVIDNSAYLKVGMESTTAYRIYIKPTAYPVIPDGNEVRILQILFTTYSITGSGTLQLYKIAGNADFEEADYSLGDMLYMDSYDGTPKFEFSFYLPIDEYNNSGDGYVIKNSSEVAGNNNVTLYSSRSAAGNHPTIVATYAPSGMDNKITALYNSAEDRYIRSSSDSALQIPSSLSIAELESALWKFQSTGTGSFRIVSKQYSGKCLAVDESGNVVLTSKQTSTTDKKQLWYVMVTGDQYAIVNEQTKRNLYIDASGSLVCRSTTTEYQWKFTIPDFVVTLQNATSALYLKSLTGLNYDGETIGLGTYDTTDAYDKFGFRLINISSQDGWKVAPITSCNGQYRVLTNNDSGASIKMYSYNVSSPNQKFELELQSDGTYVISLKSNANMVLTGSSFNAIMATRSESLTNQKWILSEYQYTSPQSTITDDYSKVEDYYKSLGFRSPFRNNTTNDQGVIVTNGEFTVSSDYGLRNLGDHAGLDISSAEGTKLYSIATGKVVYRDNDPDTDPGRYVIIETDYYEYDSNGTGRKVYLIYMHMQHVSINVNTVITAETIGDLELGTSGTSGKNGDQSYDPHLHLGVFLAPAGTTEFENYSNQLWVKNHPNRTALNPLLFIKPNRCVIRP